MIIKIKRNYNPPEMSKRKVKIKELFENDNAAMDKFFYYEWSLQGESQFESIEDFHLFCLSITKDLFADIFKTNENGSLVYDLTDFSEEQRVFLIKSLKILHTKIGEMKIEKDKKIKEKLDKIKK